MPFFQIKMARTAKKPGLSPRPVRTPGSYRVPGGDGGGGSAKSPLNKTRKRGRPIAKKTKAKPRKPVRERATYTEVDMVEAVRLVREDGYAKKTAALATNSVKLHVVPVQTLRDRLDRPDPTAMPVLGRPQEWN